MQVELAGMRFVVAGPLNAVHRFQALVAHPAVHGAQGAHLVPDALGNRRSPIAAQAPGEVIENFNTVAAARGGSTARRTRWTLRSLLVTVPSDSHQPAAAGSTTSAIAAVLVRNKSCTSRNSRP